MKLISIILFGLFLSNFCSAQENNLNKQPHETVFGKEKLKGRVKSLTQSNYEAVEKFGEIIKGKGSWNGNMQTVFNEVGYPSESHMIFNELIENFNYYGFNSYDVFKVEVFFKYNTKGEFFPIKSIGYKSDGNIVEGYISSYDEFANLVVESEHIYNPSAKKKIMINKYDKEGNMIEENEFDSNRVLLGKDKYNYNGNGKLIEFIRYNSNGSVYRTEVYKYDSKGQQIERIRYASYVGSEIERRWIYKYDSKGNRIEEKGYYSNNKLDQRIVYKYDTKGNIIEGLVYRISLDGKVKSEWARWNYKYDAQGNIIEKIASNSGGSISLFGLKEPTNNNTYLSVNSNKEKYIYYYDKNNNWIKRLNYYNDILKSITEREIEYF